MSLGMNGYSTGNKRPQAESGKFQASWFERGGAVREDSNGGCGDVFLGICFVGGLEREWVSHGSAGSTFSVLASSGQYSPRFEH